MTRLRRFPPTKAVLSLSAALFLSNPLAGFAQTSNTGPPPSSGSGAGTGTGESAGRLGSTGTGTSSTTGLGTTGTGNEAGATRGMQNPRPSGSSTLPDPLNRPPANPGQVPASRLGEPQTGLATVEPQLFEDARAVSDPGERALALARIARASIFSGQLDMAHTAVFEGGQAAKLEQSPMIRDQRINSLITSALNLAEERMREPIPLPDAPEVAEAPNQGLTPARRDQLRLAADEWRFAAELARSMGSTVTRTEASNRVVDGASYAMQTLRGEPIRLNGVTARAPAVPAEIRTYIASLLERAADEASRIERPVWRDRALVSVAQNAASSDQFELAIRVARMIPQPEIRTDALLRIAENEALTNHPKEATEAYAETARTIAMIPVDDPREVLAGVLIDSLISLGRFDDARASVVLYSNPERQGIALAAVAESQGRRGLAKSARIWIAQADPAIRPLLYRKLNDGLLNGVELNRGKELSR